jgi:tRNA(fMet)-specific endonuclease VapC
VSALHFLDTNMVIYIQRGIPTVLQRLAALGAGRIALPALVVAELAYGVEKSAYPAANRRVLEQFLQRMTVMPWTHAAMWHYARNYHALKSSGKLIGQNDLLIACQTLAEDAVLVTNNTREFERIEGLRLENWVV